MDKKLRYTLCGLLALLMLAAFSLPGRAEERILDWRSSIHVQKDSSLLVTETITVNAEHNRINHGIYRDFPTRYETRGGFDVNVGIRILSVRRDGHDEPYRVDHAQYAWGERIYMGRPDETVSSGEHTYELTYEVNRELIFGSGAGRDYDELYWNVTGNEWAFPIDQATATVYLPEGAKGQFPLIKGCTGAYGDCRGHYRHRMLTPNVVQFETSRALAPGEGFTFELGFPRGLVTQPTPLQEFYWLLRDNVGLLAGISLMVLTLGYFIAIWWFVGRDPERGVIIPLFEPPKDLSPAQVRYLMNMACDHKTFATALVSMAVKGALRIEQESGWLGLGKTYTLVTDSDSTPGLWPEEGKIFSNLLAGSPTCFKLDRENAETIRATLRAFEEALEERIQKRYFVTNTLWLFPGALLAALTFLFYQSIPPFAFWIILIGDVLVVLGFLFLLKAPTVTGRKTMDKIEGFKMYLSTAERDRMNVLNPPEVTPERFEKYLPYALALDVENEWAEKFNEALVAAGRSPSDYHSRWYVGGGHFSPREITSNVGNSLSSAVSSSLPSPSESSGGGGFSGGGGGGGGGGGW